MKAKCPNCRSVFNVSDEAKGRKTQCPKCHAVFMIQPLQESSSQQLHDGVDTTMDCPFCGEKILQKAKKCKHCGEFLSGRPSAVPVPFPPKRSATPQPALQKTSGLAIASLILGLLGVSIPGLICGMVSLVKIKKNSQTLKGGGMALAGTIFSIVTLLLQIVFMVFVMPHKDFSTLLAQSDTNATDPNRKIPFMCTNTDCNTVEFFTVDHLQKTQQSSSMGPLVLDCPKCQKHTLTQAVACPACGEVFIMNMDPQKGIFDDKCPKCGESYSKAWQERNQSGVGNSQTPSSSGPVYVIKGRRIYHRPGCNLLKEVAGQDLEVIPSAAIAEQRNFLECRHCQLPSVSTVKSSESVSSEATLSSSFDHECLAPIVNALQDIRSRLDVGTNLINYRESVVQLSTAIANAQNAGADSTTLKDAIESLEYHKMALEEWNGLISLTGSSPSISTLRESREFLRETHWKDAVEAGDRFMEQVQ